MEKEYCIVLTTLPGEREAESLAEGILASRLGACIQVSPVRSFFVWDKEVRREEEVVLAIKTSGARYRELEAYILDYHPYDVPEIVKVPLEGGLPAYLEWLDAATGPSA